MTKTVVNVFMLASLEVSGVPCQEGKIYVVDAADAAKLFALFKAREPAPGEVERLGITPAPTPAPTGPRLTADDRARLKAKKAAETGARPADEPGERGGRGGRAK